MPHLIDRIENKTIQQTILLLSDAHEYLIKSATELFGKETHSTTDWGQKMKRHVVDLPLVGKPEIVLKESEKLMEIINIVASCERMMDGLRWFLENPKYHWLSVRMCHPSTSDEDAGNDLILSQGNKIVVRCEVCDVVGARPAQNSKERKSLGKLGILNGFPDDGVERFICTSVEWKNGLTNKHRHWNHLRYCYFSHEVGSGSSTFLLEVKPAAT